MEINAVELLLAGSWRSNEIENVVVPIIGYKKQEQIAKRVVEIAIEEKEDVALEFIKKENK